MEKVLNQLNNAWIVYIYVLTYTFIFVQHHWRGKRGAIVYACGSGKSMNSIMHACRLISIWCSLLHDYSSEEPYVYFDVIINCMIGFNIIWIT